MRQIEVRSTLSLLARLLFIVTSAASCAAHLYVPSRWTLRLLYPERTRRADGEPTYRRWTANSIVPVRLEARRAMVGAGAGSGETVFRMQAWSEYCTESTRLDLCPPSYVNRREKKQNELNYSAQLLQLCD